MLHLICAIAVTMVLLVNQMEGACSIGPLESSSTMDASGNNVIEQYCIYKNDRYAINTKRNYSYPDCLNCECTGSGLSCCGYGVRAGVILPPEGCQLASGTCELRLVKTSDPSQPCFETKSSTTTPAHTKKRCVKKNKYDA